MQDPLTVSIPDDFLEIRAHDDPRNFYPMLTIRDDIRDWLADHAPSWRRGSTHRSGHRIVFESVAEAVHFKLRWADA